MNERSGGSAVWWGELDLPDGELRRWRVGPVTMWGRRRDYELEIASVREPPEGHENGVERPESVALDDPPAEAERSRVVRVEPSAALRLLPALADRPVVVRPDTSFFLLPGDRVALYVTTPLWLRLEHGAPARQVFEAASTRPSDSWFGPSTREGELCYASRTKARLRFEDLEVRPARAVTELLVENNGVDRLFLERVKIPVPTLSLFAAADGTLWTETLTVTRQKSGAIVDVRVSPKPPSRAGEATKLAGPRHNGARNVLALALDALLG